MSDTRSAEWTARLVITFVGVPSLGLALTAGVLNVQSTAAIASTDSQERVLLACSAFATAFAVGIPIAGDVLRARSNEFADVARAVWFGAIGATTLAALVSASSSVSFYHTDMLTLIGRATIASAPAVPFAALVALVELGAAYGLKLTVRTVRELLEPQQAVVTKLEPAPALAPVGSPAPVTDPEIGWRTWFQSCVTIAKGGRVTTKDAYSHYEAWAGLNNIPSVLPYVTFGRRMTDAVEVLGGKVASSNGRYYSDVSLAQLGADGVLIREPEFSDA